jgi:hypothetical protein
MLLVGLAGTIAALVWETYGAKTPLIKVHLINDLSSLGAYLSAMILGMLVSSSSMHPAHRPC